MYSRRWDYTAGISAVSKRRHATHGGLSGRSPLSLHTHSRLDCSRTSNISPILICNLILIDSIIMLGVLQLLLSVSLLLDVLTIASAQCTTSTLPVGTTTAVPGRTIQTSFSIACEAGTSIVGTSKGLGDPTTYPFLDFATAVFDPDGSISQEVTCLNPDQPSVTYNLPVATWDVQLSDGSQVSFSTTPINVTINTDNPSISPILINGTALYVLRSLDTYALDLSVRMIAGGGSFGDEVGLASNMGIMKYDFGSISYSGNIPWESALEEETPQFVRNVDNYTNEYEQILQYNFTLEDRSGVTYTNYYWCFSVVDADYPNAMCSYTKSSDDIYQSISDRCICLNIFVEDYDACVSRCSQDVDLNNYNVSCTDSAECLLIPIGNDDSSSTSSDDDNDDGHARTLRIVLPLLALSLVALFVGYSRQNKLCCFSGDKEDDVTLQTSTSRNPYENMP